MINTRTLTSLAAAVLGLTMMAPNCPTCGPRPDQAPSSNVMITVGGLTKPQFDALPANAIVMQKGGMRMTKSEIVARATKQRADAMALRQQRLRDFQAHRARVLSDDQAKLRAKNAKLYAELTRLHQAQVAMSPQRQALEREARDISMRSRNASPAERAQLNQRAAMALRQLRSSAPTSPNIRGPMNNR
jgi:hypothetical protein